MSMPGGNRSRMPPRTAYSPGSRTVEVRHEAVELKPSDDARHVEAIAGRGRQRLLGDHLARRHPLQHGIDGRQQHRRMLAPLEAGQPRQRRHALRDDARHAATPGRRAGSPRPGTPAPRCPAQRSRSACASAAMRGPSRQITSRLVAGASARAATARARSPITRPSTPSTTCASVSGCAAGHELGGGRFAWRLHARSPIWPPWLVKIAQALQQRAIVVRRRLGVAGDPAIDVRVGRLHQPLEFVEFGRR